MLEILFIILILCFISSLSWWVMAAPNLAPPWHDWTNYQTQFLSDICDTPLQRFFGSVQSIILFLPGNCAMDGHDVTITRGVVWVISASLTPLLEIVQISLNLGIIFQMFNTIYTVMRVFLYYILNVWTWYIKLWKFLGTSVPVGFMKWSFSNTT